MAPAHEADFEEFVAAHGRSLRRTAYLMCGDWARAEDATQEALLALYRRWPRVTRHGGNVRAYAHRAVTTAVIDQSRRPWRREVSADVVPDGSAPTGGSVDHDPMAATDRRVAVISALRQLPERRRACLVLRYFSQLSVEETADLLGVTTGTVKSQTARALDQVRAALLDAGLDIELEETP